MAFMCLCFAIGNGKCVILLCPLMLICADMLTNGQSYRKLALRIIK